jgi:hypothetical protein
VCQPDDGLGSPNRNTSTVKPIVADRLIQSGAPQLNPARLPKLNRLACRN